LSASGRTRSAIASNRLNRAIRHELEGPWETCGPFLCLVSLAGQAPVMILPLQDEPNF
jgi:hypothetical protein